MLTPNPPEPPGWDGLKKQILLIVWTGLHPISPKVRKFEGSRVRRFFSPKVRKLEKKVLESERKGSVVRRSRIPKS